MVSAEHIAPQPGQLRVLHVEDNELDGRIGDAAAGPVLPGVYDELLIELRDAGGRYGRVYVCGEFGWRGLECERACGRDVAGHGDVSGGWIRDH